MVDLVMRKRAARYKGEVGFFVETEIFEEDFQSIKLDAEVMVKATTPRSLKQHKFAWALATKCAEASDHAITKDDMMDYLLVEARHYRKVWDPFRQKVELKPKPTNFGAMDGTAYTRLLNRIIYVVTTLVVPGLSNATLRAEIEAMIAGPDNSPHGDFR